jgi:hypothetical protein
MDRKTWTVAWRHARRNMGRMRRVHGEAVLLDYAERELGRRVTLTEQCAALRCWQSRHWGPATASFATARTKRFYALADKCRDRWEREASAAAALAWADKESARRAEDARYGIEG